MKTIVSKLLLPLLCSGPAMVQAQKISPDAKKARIILSYFFSFARVPSDAELNWWVAQPDLTVDQLVENHRNFMYGSGESFQKPIIELAYIMALGKLPAGHELEHFMMKKKVFIEIVNDVTAEMKRVPSLHEQMIRNSYQLVFFDDPRPDELNYWKGQPVVTCLELVENHRNYLKSDPSRRKKTYKVASSGVTVHADRTTVSGISGQSSKYKSGLVQGNQLLLPKR